MKKIFILILSLGLIVNAQEFTKTELLNLKDGYPPVVDWDGELDSILSNIITGYANLIDDKASSSEIQAATDTSKFVTPFGLNSFKTSGFIQGDNVIYVSKDGDNSNDGSTPFNSKLTISSALTTANDSTPTLNDKWTVYVLDGATYSEDIIINDYITVYAPFARFNGATTLNDDSRLYVDRYIFNSTSGVFSVIRKDATSTNYDSYIVANRISITNSGGFTDVNNYCSSTSLNIYANEYTCSSPFSSTTYQINAYIDILNSLGTSLFSITGGVFELYLKANVINCDNFLVSTEPLADVTIEANIINNDNTLGSFVALIDGDINVKANTVTGDNQLNLISNTGGNGNIQLRDNDISLFGPYGNIESLNINKFGGISNVYDDLLGEGYKATFSKTNNVVTALFEINANTTVNADRILGDNSGMIPLMWPLNNEATNNAVDYGFVLNDTVYVQVYDSVSTLRVNLKNTFDVPKTVGFNYITGYR